MSQHQHQTPVPHSRPCLLRLCNRQLFLVPHLAETLDGVLVHAGAGRGGEQVGEGPQVAVSRGVVQHAVAVAVVRRQQRAPTLLQQAEGTPRSTRALYALSLTSLEGGVYVRDEWIPSRS